MQRSGARAPERIGYERLLELLVLGAGIRGRPEGHQVVQRADPVPRERDDIVAAATARPIGVAPVRLHLAWCL
jgi:hypothetical protein